MLLEDEDIPKISKIVKIGRVRLTRRQTGNLYTGESCMIAFAESSQLYRIYFFYSVGGIAWLNFAKSGGTWKYFWG